MNSQPTILIWTYFLTEGNGFFFNWDSLHARLNSLQEKEAQKDYIIQGIFLERTYS